MQAKNIHYKSKQIASYFISNRQTWEQFYPSEKWVLEKVFSRNKTLGDVLDVGCACGGLGSALSERFTINSYTGVDINKDAVDWAKKNKKLPVPVTFIAADILDERLNKTYDLVTSLSCADWNIETGRIIGNCWERVKPGGYFIVSLRVSEKDGINDIKKSYQYINYDSREDDPEVANYVVFNFREALKMFKGLNPRPELIGSYGYWGTPSTTAVTPYRRLLFSVFYIKKSPDAGNQKIDCEFNLPLDIFLCGEKA